MDISSPTQYRPADSSKTFSTATIEIDQISIMFIAQDGVQLPSSPTLM